MAMNERQPSPAQDVLWIALTTPFAPVRPGLVVGWGPTQTSAQRRGMARLMFIAGEAKASPGSLRTEALCAQARAGEGPP